jgi:hypothetical protein
MEHDFKLALNGIFLSINKLNFNLFEHPDSYLGRRFFSQ